MATIFDNWQTTFFFNSAANGVMGQSVPVHLDPRLSRGAALKKAAAAAGETLTGMLKNDIASAISNAGAALGATDWTVVWGPQVLCINPNIGSVKWFPFYTASFNATNAFYVVYSATLQRYIVAIAATNFISFYDWLVEDFDTSKVVAWEGALQVWNGGTNNTSPGAGVPCISQGTFTGVGNLLGMVDSVITGKTLIAWLKTVTPPSGTTLTFTGHSLAGALSPTLALACFDPTSGLLKGTDWAVGNAMVYPTAGATPGNQPFASAFNGAGWAGAGQNGSEPWQAWNTDMYNNVDVVPHAWGAPMIELLPGLYSVYYDARATDVIEKIVNKARATAEKGEAIAGPYTPINNQALDSLGNAGAATEFVYRYTIHDEGGHYQEYLTTTEAAENPAAADQTDISWVHQALFQHTTAYGRLILEKAPQPAKKL